MWKTNDVDNAICSIPGLVILLLLCLETNKKREQCDSCRQRKVGWATPFAFMNGCSRVNSMQIRCDNLPESCRNCRTYGGECVITRDGRSVPRSKKPTSRLYINRSSLLKEARASNRQGHHTNPESQLSPSQSLFSATPTPMIDCNDMSPNGQPTPPQQPQPGVARRSPSPPSDFSPMDHVSRSADSVQGVVTTEVGHSPKNSKFAGITSSQVFAKSVEELFKPVAPHIDVMAFFCPTMTFAEELPLRSPDQHPLVDKSIADSCLHRM